MVSGHVFSTRSSFGAEVAAGPDPAVHGRGAEDVQVVTRLLGRTPTCLFTVVVRGADGDPDVIANEPFLFDGTPMPTRYWLVDPEMCQGVSRLESTGGVKSAAAEVDCEELATAHELYGRERDRLVPPGHTGPRPSGGVGGTRQGVKCLHAHLAWWLAGGPDPVGEWVARRLGLSREGARAG